MADIKTKDNAKGTIRTIDKAAVATQRMKQAYVEYQHLSYDGSILGMTSFTEMGVQVFEDDDNEAFFFLDGKTVLVEKDLNFDSKLKGRKNFTLINKK